MNISAELTIYDDKQQVSHTHEQQAGKQQKEVEYARLYFYFTFFQFHIFSIFLCFIWAAAAAAVWEGSTNTHSQLTHPQHLCVCVRGTSEYAEWEWKNIQNVMCAFLLHVLCCAAFFCISPHFACLLLTFSYSSLSLPPLPLHSTPLSFFLSPADIFTTNKKTRSLSYVENIFFLCCTAYTAQHTNFMYVRTYGWMMRMNDKE